MDDVEPAVDERQAAERERQRRAQPGPQGSEHDEARDTAAERDRSGEGVLPEADARPAVPERVVERAKQEQHGGDAEQDDVKPDRIGALGLSTGADVLIEAAATRDDIAALVTDGAAAASFEDWAHLRGTEVGTPPGWVMFTTMRVLSGDPPGPPLEDLVARIKPPTRLISAGREEEREFNVLYDRAAPATLEHWNLPDASHTDAVREFPQEYQRRVLAHFDEALG